VKQVQAELTLHLEVPRLKADQWLVFAPQLPVLSCQTGVSSTLEPDGEPGRELSTQHRGILRARITAKTPDQKKSLDLRLAYQATLLSRKLVRRSAGQGPPGVSPPSPLDDDERQTALAAGGLFDFQSEPFRRWRDEAGLTRRDEEGEIDYARRVFLAIKKGFHYTFRDDLDRHASQICRAGESDCGGLSTLFVSVLRSSTIPARLLVGRWAKSATMEQGKLYAQWHVKAEFYAEGIGWVPADLACAVLHDRSPRGLAYFASDAGDFLVMHLDPDFVFESGVFGRATVTWLQRPAYFARGGGSFDEMVTREDWQVKTGEPPALVEAELKKPAAAAKKTRRGRAPIRPR
jgi:transglutaminase-like putative cysteine protease